MAHPYIELITSRTRFAVVGFAFRLMCRPAISLGVTAAALRVPNYGTA
jgi:hypothetical protein